MRRMAAVWGVVVMAVGPPSGVAQERSTADPSRVVSETVTSRHPHPPLDASLTGMLWHPPASLTAARREMRRMHDSGVRLVRTSLLPEPLLTQADELGLRLYQDLPFASLSAATLRDSLRRMDEILRAALARAEGHPSAVGFGLTQGSDTSDRSACGPLRGLTKRARAARAQTYLETRFVKQERCADAVDVVLIDARETNPVTLMERWRAYHDTPVGLVYGWGVRPGRAGGHLTPGTPTAQGRRLETALNDFLALTDPPTIAFLARWRDVAGKAAGPQAEVADLHYGLVGEAGEARPAQAVARGFFTGAQRVFAFDAGRAPPESRQASPLILLGWGLTLGLALLYSGAPRFNTLLPQYFTRRDRFREAVQRGYDLGSTLSATLGVGLALCVGLVTASTLRALGRTDALAVATAGWGGPLRARAYDLLGHPLWLVGLAAVAYGTWLVLNLVWLNLLTGRSRRIRPAQALSLAIWPRWPWVPLTVVALWVGTLDAVAAAVAAPIVLGIGVVAEVLAGFRMSLEFARVIRVPVPKAVLMGFGLPLLAISVLIGWGLAMTDDTVAFLWHVATRE